MSAAAAWQTMRETDQSQTEYYSIWVHDVDDCSSTCIIASVQDVVRESSFFSAYHERWSAHTVCPLSMELCVRSAAHVAMCCHVFAYMRHRQLPPEVYGSAKLLLLVLEMADFLGCPALLDDGLQYMYAHVAAPHPSWSLLLCCCADSAADSIASSTKYPPLQHLATRKALQQLQDLECVLQQTHTTAQLLSLSFELLLQLVSSFETRVAQESTVVTAVHLWLEGQPAGSVSLQQKQALARQIRLLGLPSGFLGGVLPHVTWYCEAVYQDTMMQAHSFLLLHKMWVPTTQPSHSGSSCQGIIGAGAALGYSPAVSGPPATSSSSLGRMLGCWLADLPPEQAEFWRLALLRERRVQSGCDRLLLSVRASLQQLATAYKQRASGAWQHGQTHMFAGVGWRLSWRFCDIKLQQHARQRALPPVQAGSSAQQLQQQEEEELDGEEEVDSSRTSANAATATAACEHWQLQAGVSFSAYGVKPGIKAHLALPGLELQHHAAVWPGGSLRTRGALRLCGGVALQQQQQLVAAGQVMPCLQLLPTNLSSSHWDEQTEQSLQQFIGEGNSTLHLRVTLKGIP